MKAASLERIFEPFYTTKFSGRGLGLAAVKSIIERHGGAIRAESEPGRGSTFFITLPASDSPVGENTEVFDTSTDTFNGLMLAVDDEPPVLKVTAAMLERIGFEVVTATGGEDALVIARERLHELTGAVVDLTMPGMDGIEVLRELRQLRTDLPVLLVSGWNEEPINRLLANDPAAAFLPKPFTMDGFRDAIRSLHVVL